MFSGSTRRDSLNRRCIKVAHEAAEALGHEATLIDLADFEMPIYNGDWEAENGLPDAARRLKEMIAGSNALVISTPEYNGSFPALLKNTLDWCSRAGGGLDGRAVFEDTKVVLLAATPGPRAGARVLPALTQQMEVLRTIVVAAVGIGKAGEEIETPQTAEQVGEALRKLGDDEEKSPQVAL